MKTHKIDLLLFFILGSVSGLNEFIESLKIIEPIAVNVKPRTLFDYIFEAGAFFMFYFFANVFALLVMMTLVAVIVTWVEKVNETFTDKISTRMIFYFAMITICSANFFLGENVVVWLFSS